MKRTVVLLAMLALLAPAVHAGDEPAGASDRGTTVKSSKSNSQDRRGGGVGEQPTPMPPAANERGKSVKGSKSDTSE